MLKKTITFVDYDGNARTEDHYFNLNEAEALKLELMEKGGLTEKINRIIAAQDIPVIMETFEDFIKKSYGIKSPDGREFMKSDEITRKFMQTEAYSKFMIELCTKDGAAAEFVNAIIPTAPQPVTNA
jgi:hypothetical protein